MFFDGAKIQHFFDSTKFFTEKIQKLTLFNNYLKKICHQTTNITIIPIRNHEIELITRSLIFIQNFQF